MSWLLPWVFAFVSRFVGLSDHLGLTLGFGGYVCLVLHVALSMLVPFALNLGL